MEIMSELAIQVDKTWDEVAPVIKAKAWKRWPIETQVTFRDALATAIALLEDLRSDFDEAVWRGHDDGTVKRAVESIRTRTVHTTKPGRPEPTAAELKARALAKKGIVLAEVVSEESEVTEAE